MKRDIKTHGQHFLRGSSFIAELVGHGNIRKNDTVLDIGAGSGAISDVLARRAKYVVAYEPEKNAAAKLRSNIGNRTNVKIIEKDFLSAVLPDDPYKVFSNIPFHLSSKIVRKLVSAKKPPKAIYLIVQKQFAQKMIAAGDHFHGALGSAIAPWWVARIRRPLRKTDFTPPPAVDTVLLELKPREETLLDKAQQAEFMAFVERCYAEPVYFHKVAPHETRKPSTLSVEQWVQLFVA